MIVIVRRSIVVLLVIIELLLLLLLLMMLVICISIIPATRTTSRNSTTTATRKTIKESVNNQIPKYKTRSYSLSVVVKTLLAIVAPEEIVVLPHISATVSKFKTKRSNISNLSHQSKLLPPRTVTGQMAIESLIVACSFAWAGNAIASAAVVDSVNDSSSSASENWKWRLIN